MLYSLSKEDKTTDELVSAQSGHNRGQCKRASVVCSPQKWTRCSAALNPLGAHARFLCTDTDLVVTPRCPAWQSHLLDP